MKSPQLIDRVSYLVDACHDQRVLHLGCTNAPYTAQSIADGSLLHDRLAEVSAELWGVDQDRDGLEVLASRGTQNLVEADLHSLHRATLPSDLQVIVAGEIIEHLSNPGLFLDSVRRVMTGDTRLIITTINAYCAMRFARYALRGRGGIAEPVHPDHVAYYSYSTLHQLLRRHGMAVTNFAFYDLGKEHRPHNRSSLNLINDVCVAISRQLADGLVCDCRLSP